jgi:hypothetical protein
MKKRAAMIELDSFLLEGVLLETLHPALQKNKHPTLAIYWKLPTWPGRNYLLLSHYLRRVRGPLKIFPHSDLPGVNGKKYFQKIFVIALWHGRIQAELVGINRVY